MVFAILLSSSDFAPAAELRVPEGTLIKISLETPLSSRVNKTVISGLIPKRYKRNIKKAEKGLKTLSLPFFNGQI
jgi:hypothetical protein